jgi:Transposase IS66 family
MSMTHRYPVLAPGTGKTKTGRLWTYVRDERPFGGARPPGALFFYSPDRKGEHPQAHLNDFRGVIHADGYAGFNELFVGGRIVEAGCWAHVRRKFFDVHTATGSPIAKEALDRIGQLYAVETTINGSRYPSGDDSSASCSPSRLPRRWLLGPTRLCASSRANPSSPRPSAICGRAGLPSVVALMTAGWRSTTIPPNGPCVALRRGVHCAPLLQASGNIGI